MLGLHFNDKNVKIDFSESIRAIAPGQSAVLYKNNECLGGGIIAKALKDNSKSIEIPSDQM